MDTFELNWDRDLSDAAGPGMDQSNQSEFHDSPTKHQIWTEIRRETIETLQGEAILYRHHSGLEVLLAKNNDPHRFFSVSFKTAPESDRGEPHVTEHMIFRGSDAYPAQEPFSAYLKASLYTESNAATGVDHTSYYHSSPDYPDFLNQINLTMDGVFKPLMRAEAFREEAWRIDLDQNGAPSLNGIVLNEMKGALSDPEYIHHTVVCRELLKDTPFAYNAAGQPESITELTLSDLKEWHHRNYSPARCRVFLYGDLEEEGILKVLTEHIPNRPFILEVDKEPAPREFQRIRRITHLYPGGELEDASKDSIVTLNWRLQPSTGDLRKDLATQVLFNNILCGSDSSPLTSVLIESGLGEDIFGGEINYEPPYPIFTIGLSGTAAYKQEEIEGLIQRKLENIVHEGIPADLIEKVCSGVIFAEREDLGSSTRGIDVSDTVFISWMRGQDPIQSLKLLSNLNDLKQYLLEQPEYLTKLLSEQILENKNRVTITLRPNRALVEEAETKERSLAKKIYEEAGAQRSVLLLENAGERDTLSDTASIPRLKTAEIEFPESRIREIKRDPRVLVHEAQTHGLGHVNIGFSFRGVELSEISDVGILSNLLLGMDAGDLSWREASDKFDHRSSISCSLDILRNYSSGELDGRININLVADSEILPDLLSRIRALPNKLDLSDRKRFITVLRENLAHRESDLFSNGMSWAMQRAQAHLDLGNYLRDMTGGIGYLRALRSTIWEAKNRWTPVLERLEKNLGRIAGTSDIRAQICADQKTLDLVLPHLESMCRTDDGNMIQPAPLWTVPQLTLNEGFTIPSSVSFLGQAYDIHDHTSLSSVEVAINHLENTYLWDNIRRSGGAYSTGLDWDREGRVLALGAGRDPSVISSIKIFESIPSWLKSRFFGAEELRRSIIGPLGELVAPMDFRQSSREMFRNWLRDTPPGQKIRNFEEIKKTETKDIHALADSLERSKEKGSPIVILGSRRSLEALKKAKGQDWISVESLE